MKTQLLRTQLRRPFLLAGLMAGLVGGPSAFAQGEDEWYDPTDWFDGNNIEADDTYDYSAYDYDYDYGFDDTYDYGSDWNDYDTWGTDRWDADYYDSDYWDDYDWNDRSTTTADTSSSNATTNRSNQRSNNTTDRNNPDAGTATVYTFTVFAVPTDGQQASTTKGQSDSAKQRSGSKQTKQNQSGQQQVATLKGTIEGLQTMNLKQASGATGRYTVANIRLENGRNTIVNLGRSSRLNDIELEKGDSIQALGREGRIAGKTVFVAHKLKANGQTIDANPVIRLADRQKAQNQKQKTIQGTVKNISQSSSRAQNNHTLLNLQLENGQAATVDLGPAVSLDQIDLQEGETVTVRGRTRQMEGREVLIPDLMKVEGQKVAAVSE